MKKKGFTLIELLVVIAIIGILAGMIFPAVQKGMSKAKGTKIGNSGKQIWMALFAENTDLEANNLGGCWPSDADATTSAYWNRCLDATNNYLQGFGNTAFMAPGCSAPNDASSTVLPANNAWSVVKGLGAGDSGDTPFMYTKNIDPGGKTLDAIHAIAGTDSPPLSFGTEMGVIVTWGGAFKVITAKQVNTPTKFDKVFNPADSTAQSLAP